MKPKVSMHRTQHQHSILLQHTWASEERNLVMSRRLERTMYASNSTSLSCCHEDLSLVRIIVITQHVAASVIRSRIVWMSYSIMKLHIADVGCVESPCIHTWSTSLARTREKTRATYLQIKRTPKKTAVRTCVRSERPAGNVHMFQPVLKDICLLQAQLRDGPAKSN